MPAEGWASGTKELGFSLLLTTPTGVSRLLAMLLGQVPAPACLGRLPGEHQARGSQGSAQEGVEGFLRSHRQLYSR